MRPHDADCSARPRRSTRCGRAPRAARRRRASASGAGGLLDVGAQRIGGVDEQPLQTRDRAAAVREARADAGPSSASSDAFGERLLREEEDRGGGTTRSGSGRPTPRATRGRVPRAKLRRGSARAAATHRVAQRRRVVRRHVRLDRTERSRRRARRARPAGARCDPGGGAARSACVSRSGRSARGRRSSSPSRSHPRRDSDASASRRSARKPSHCAVGIVGVAYEETVAPRGAAGDRRVPSRSGRPVRVDVVEVEGSLVHLREGGAVFASTVVEAASAR